MTQWALLALSPWPIFVGWVSLSIVFNLILTMWASGVNGLLASGISILLLCYQWWRDLTREATWSGSHTLSTQAGLNKGSLLFILSEVIFFVSFFWAFFHSSLSPTIQIGSQWPPSNILPFDPYSIPLLNTVILVSSGVTLTWSHFNILNHNWSSASTSLIITLFLAFTFSILQTGEYSLAPFTMADSVYGSTFFLATGFHGLHVIIGTIFLIVCLFRCLKRQISPTHHLGFELASWYWHFVDAVWLFLYLFIYIWSS